MRGSPEVSPTVVDGRRCLRLPFTFAGTQVERASWDRQLDLDLSTGDGVEFEVYTRDASAVSYFSIYFQTGAGWFHSAFFPESNGSWRKIRVPKREMSGEGQPGGWHEVKTIRISAWRGADADGEFYLSNLKATGVLGEDALVAIVEGDWAAERLPGEGRAMKDAAQRVANALEGKGVRCVRQSDRSVKLQNAQLLLLPYNPALPPEALAEVTRYVRSGGRVVAFYALPAELMPLLGMQDGPQVRAEREGQFAGIRVRQTERGGVAGVAKQLSWNIRNVQPVPGRGEVWAEWLNDRGEPTGYPAVVLSTNCAFMTHILLPEDLDLKGEMLLALTGRLAPQVARRAAEASVEAMGRVASYNSYEAADAGIRGVGRRKAEVRAALDAAGQSRKRAEGLIREQRWGEARKAAAEGQARLLEAFYRAQEPQPDEFRAFWCHSAMGVRGVSWDEAIARLAENGFTAILPNMLWGGVAYYASEVLPAAREVAEEGDQIRECLAAARKHGVQVHVWKVNWNLGSRAPREFVERMRAAGRLQADATGKEEPWLCPSHPENQQLEIASMVEVARKYAVDGLHFDYIRYPDNNHCFCAGCRERFTAASGGKLRQWPGDALRDGPLRQQWLDWRRSHIDLVVRETSKQAKAVRPGIKISAAVFRQWTTDRDSVGQDWKLWCDRGWLDFVCPMDYTPSNNSFESMVRKQLEWSGKTPCYPGIGYSASSSHFGPDRAIEQILISRQHKTGGFVIFNYGVNEHAQLLPKLGLGVTRPEGSLSERQQSRRP
jgi:uncharacterized lipoprotein YddW (UPF0748 family)